MAEESGGDAKRRPLMMFELGKCGRCRYWLVHGDDPFNLTEENGCCRRFPRNVRNESVPGGYFYPITPRESFGCGEYAPANPETVEEGAATLARFVLLGDMTAARALADKLVGGD